VSIDHEFRPNPRSNFRQGFYRPSYRSQSASRDLPPAKRLCNDSIRICDSQRMALPNSTQKKLPTSLMPRSNWGKLNFILEARRFRSRRANQQTQRRETQLRAHRRRGSRAASSNIFRCALFDPANQAEFCIVCRAAAAASSSRLQRPTRTVEPPRGLGKRGAGADPVIRWSKTTHTVSATKASGPSE
jgi:hypothetical protein